MGKNQMRIIRVIAVGVSTGILMFAGFLVVGYLMDLRDERVQAATIERIKSEMAKELPTGTGKDKILMFIAAHHMQHAEMTKCLSSDPTCKSAFLIKAWVSIERDSRSWTNILTSFYLDEDGTLRDREMSESHSAD